MAKYNIQFYMRYVVTHYFISYFHPSTQDEPERFRAV